MNTFGSFDREALAADRPLGHTAAHNGLEDMTQEIALPA